MTDNPQTTELDPVTAMHAKQDPIGNTLGEPLLDKTVHTYKTDNHEHAKEPS